ncbi:GAF domain-containing protein [Caballeronia sp. BR00000012568055]|uniref:GAF domain-containing protein n=1 Tax=Caballeronia sp. BR00000012568055 TaxID=2918761 RepID=UPI0023F80019|nr:GAF domain-containing protein [Caballeronia sp. BR00000012568055]
MAHRPAPLPQDESARLAALQHLGILDTLPESSYDDVVQLASTICDVPIALVSLIDAERQWFKACIGLDVQETHRDQAFCAHSILRPSEVLVVNDAAADERFCDNPLVTGAPHIRFYAGAPIVSDDGQALGTVCVIDRTPRTLSSRQLEALKTLARQTARLLHSRESELKSETRSQAIQEKISRALADDDSSNVALRRQQRVSSVGQLTGGVAHDFNNLLQTISTSLQLAKRKSTEPDQVVRWTQTGLDAVRKGADLIAQILSFSRDQSTGTEELCVSKHVAAMRELLGRTLGTGIRIEFELGTYECLVKCNPAQLEAAVLNLVINARDALDGTGTITVRTRRVIQREFSADTGLAAGEYVELSVIDDGPGMPPEIAERAFEPFFTTKAEGKGTGLGLAQVCGFALAAGGVARVETSLGNGTAVVVCLRIVELATTESTDNDTRVHSTDEFVLSSGLARILLVDEDQELRISLSELLAAAGYHVSLARSGVEALSVFEVTIPDIVIADLGMHGMDGALLARVIEEMYPRVPVVFTTGMLADADFQSRLPPQAIVLHKPVLLADITDVIERLCRS